MSRVSSWVRCNKCGEMVNFSKLDEHTCGVLQILNGLDFRKMSHRQVVDYYSENIEEIESGLQLLWKNFPIYKTKVDIIARDREGNICLVEIAHSRSHYQKSHWKRKLRKQQIVLRRMGMILFKSKKFSPRLLIFRPKKGAEEVKD